MLLSELKIVSQPRQLSEKQVRLQEVKSIQEHMDRYLERDATTMEMFLFIEERIDELKR